MPFTASASPAPAAAARAIHILLCGSFTVLRSFFVGGEGVRAGLTPVRAPVLCFAIQLEGGGWIVVDAGVREVRPAGMPFEPAAGLAGHLAALGVERRDVLAVALTHLDYDHTAGLPDLADRPVYVTRDEWAAGEHPSFAERLVGRRATRDFRGLHDVREVVFEGDDEVVPIAESRGAVSLLPLPGHTPGHAGVLVRLASGGRVLLCGDACYAAECVTRAAPFGLLPRLVAFDLLRAERSLERLRRLHALEPDLRVIPSHDPTTLALLAASSPAARTRVA